MGPMVEVGKLRTEGETEGGWAVVNTNSLRLDKIVREVVVWFVGKKERVETRREMNAMKQNVETIVKKRNERNMKLTA